MSLIGKEPELTKHFINTATLFTALMRETNADSSKNTTVIDHHESGDKYDVELIIKKRDK